MKKCLTALAIREIQIKITLRFHLTPVVKMAIIKNTTINVGEVIRWKRKPLHCWRECK
jgi:hypothetical protein